jgi:hypothetical protein
MFFFPIFYFTPMKIPTDNGSENKSQEAHTVKKRQGKTTLFSHKQISHCARSLAIEVKIAVRKDFLPCQTLVDSIFILR